MGEDTNRHAIVFGASGLIGWALVDQLLQPYPHAGSFSKVTAVTNRPLNLAESHWPDAASHRPDLQLVSGIDLRHGDAAALAESLKQAVQDIESVTHIYYLGMSPSQSLIRSQAMSTDSPSLP
jgi:nucleoside-diphosphate-sugar epimerase